jgi:hypothetical protein
VEMSGDIDLLKSRQLYGVDVQQLEDAQLDAVAGCRWRSDGVRMAEEGDQVDWRSVRSLLCRRLDGCRVVEAGKLLQSCPRRA